MNLQTLKGPLRKLKGARRKLSKSIQVSKHVRRGPVAADLDAMGSKVLAFIDSLQRDERGVQFRYSASSTSATLYASCYACMTYSLLGEMKSMPQDRLEAWAGYFNSFQDPASGLFFDPAVRNDIYEDCDWWGARHLALHMVSAFTSLGSRPEHPFRFLESWSRRPALETWLAAQDWSEPFSYASDFDNKIMNVVGLMQYQRDIWGDEDAGAAVAFCQDFLLSKINPQTGLWGGYDPRNPAARSRMVQFAYHLLPIYLYDGIVAFDCAKIVDHALRTQNRFGGFGVEPNSSACEDIDSLHLLVRLAKYAPDWTTEIDVALTRALRWILINQMNDGGFVFRLNQAMTYGHSHLHAGANEGAMFPTWFRILACALVDEHFGGRRFCTQSAPGYDA